MFADALKNVMLDAAAGVITHVTVHSAYSTTGANELAVTRQAITLNAAANGILTYGNAPNVPDVPAGATVRFWGFWSALTNGTFYCMFPNGSDGLKPFYALAAGDVIHCEAHGLANDQKVTVLGEDLPAGLTAGSAYFVINATTDTLQLSLTQGGAAIDLTDEGVGVISKFVEEGPFGAQGGISLTAGELNLNLLGM